MPQSPKWHKTHNVGRYSYQSATRYGLVMGGATLENIHITFRPISTGGLIRQQHHFMKTLSISEESFRAQPFLP
jgi:hypothetical protein